MIIRRDLLQGSIEWAEARAGLLTASEFGQLVTNDFEIRTGQMPRSYLAAKVAEAWMGAPLDGFGSWNMDQGSILEDEAMPWLELELGLSIERVGLCLIEDGRVACSPDGLIVGMDTGVELKCPLAKTHTGYLLAGVVPPEYLTQIHFSMYVTGFKAWKFVSYRREPFPKLIVDVERDEEIQEKIADAVGLFLTKFDFAINRMTDLNGGPPIRRTLTPMPNREPRDLFVSDAMDVPT